ncbi:MAG TPA: nuclear transport factor 2 family protein [Rhodanobacteraceae bacterium]|nr:nuclear transport factor 2 family protein [Rhodanobacteraceae bacterium]
MRHSTVLTYSCRGMRLCTLATLIFALPAAAATAGSAKVDETARTSAAVIAVDQRWLEAEVSGDTAWLDAMLMPDYRSISAEGKVLDKPTLLAHAEKNRGSDKMRKRVEAWLKSHPVTQSVVMHGDIAILSFSDPKTGRIRSSDTFIYEDRGWHALYSQHANVE